MTFDYDTLYKKRGFQREPVKKIVKKLAELLPSRNTTSPILDLGAGDGRHTIYLADRGHTVVAVDRSQEAINKLEELAKKQDRKIAPVRADLTNINSLPQDQYAAIVCTYVLHELSPPQIKALANYVKEHLKPNGYLAMATFLGKFKKLVERIQPEFSHWPKIKEQKGMTQTVACGTYSAIEVLLQKP